MARVTITLSDDRRHPGQIDWKMTLRQATDEATASPAVDAATRMIEILKATTIASGTAKSRKVRKP